MAMQQVRSGQLRQRVTLVNDVAGSPGTRGQPVLTATTVAADIPARVTPINGRRIEIAKQQVPSATHEIEIRYRSDLPPGPAGTKKYRLTMVTGVTTRNFLIGFVNDVDERHRRLLLTCTEEPA